MLEIKNGRLGVYGTEHGDTGLERVKTFLILKPFFSQYLSHHSHLSLFSADLVEF